MSKPRRVSVIGKGREMFFPESHTDSQPSEQAPSSTSTLVQGAYYLTPKAADGLDDLWIRLRKEARTKKVTKSLLVSKAIEKLTEEAKGKQVEKILELLQ